MEENNDENLDLAENFNSDETSNNHNKNSNIKQNQKATNTNKDIPQDQ